MAFTLDQVEKYHGAVFCAANGDPIPVTSVDIVTSVNAATGVERLELHIGGLAEAVLSNPSNPQAGVQLLEGPVEISTQQVLDIKPDAQNFLNNLSRWLKLPTPIEQDLDGNWLDTLVPDDDNPDSVSSKLKKRGIYLKATKASNPEKRIQYGQFPFWFNLHLMPDREPLTKDKVASLKARFAAARAKQEAEVDYDSAA